MSKKKKKNKPKPRCMAKQDSFNWCCYKFEFDDEGGQGLAWHSGRCRGPKESVENTLKHFKKNGYKVIGWIDDV